ncbi:hypothetical protein HYH03_012172 [Edaphochlamys debaryana]|uniref:Uncharacterized protein n=1 Tax=Edaphochlamys debaryana TaxID=47281 RepID=A0A836BUT6_9CHLO|nr:hypothetical protein HYH03_012172 [Edaphochlamys debaryana]|eukprot:KAG2489342.1 hypothetical protein HYH03_012172 [Edaphochlamys debaryana]
MSNARFQSTTLASEGADEVYKRVVEDIEEQTQRAGWLFGRGAFDKADLQYLRDFNTQLKSKEGEIEDIEKLLWEKERERAEAEASAAAAAAVATGLQRRPSGGSGVGACSGLKGTPSFTSKPAPLVLPVKVKPAGSKTPQDQSAAKRLKTEGSLSSPTAPGGSLLPSARSEPGGGLGGGGGSGPTQGSASGDLSRRGSAPVSQADSDAQPGGGGGGLAGLLGGYDSGEEGSEDEAAGKDGPADGGAKQGTAGAAGASKLPPPVGLLSPEELLADPAVLANGVAAKKPEPVKGADAWRSGSDSD